MREFKNIFILFGLLIVSCFFVMPIKADTNIRLEAQENESENFTTEEPVPHQDIHKNLETGEVMVSEILSSRNSYDSSEIKVMDAYIPEGLEVEEIDTKIIGKDNRTKITKTTTFPNSAICYMEMKFPNSNDIYVGTAWMYGKRVAVTAGHCVYDAKYGGWAEWVKIYPGRNGSSSPFGSYYATVLHTDVKYINSQDGNFDWGLLEFNTDVGETTGYFGAMWKSDSMVGTRIIVRGYPSEKNATMWSMPGKVKSNNAYKLRYSIDTTRGQSGSPVYTRQGDYLGLAIHTNYASGNYNEGKRIDESLFNIMESFR